MNGHLPDFAKEKNIQTCTNMYAGMVNIDPSEKILLENIQVLFFCSHYMFCYHT